MLSGSVAGGQVPFQMNLCCLFLRRVKWSLGQMWLETLKVSISEEALESSVLNGDFINYCLTPIQQCGGGFMGMVPAP